LDTKAAGHGEMSYEEEPLIYSLLEKGDIKVVRLEWKKK